MRRSQSSPSKPGGGRLLALSPEESTDGPGHTPRARLLVLGLGNYILTDDAIGLRVVRAVRDQLGSGEGIEVVESEEMGLSLLDHIVGYGELVIVDAIQTGSEPPGFVHELDGETLPSRRVGAPHFLGVGDTLALGRLLGLPMPERVTIFALEVADPFTLGTGLTSAVQEALLPAAERILRYLRGESPPGSARGLSQPVSG